MAHHARLSDFPVTAVHHPDDWSDAELPLRPDLLQRLRTTGRHRVLAAVRHLLG